MRFFALLNLQHIVLWLFPTLVFMIIFGLALNFSYLRSRDSDERMKKILYRFPGGIEDRNAPFPLAMLLIIVGTILWVFFYILGTGLLNVKI